MEISNMSFKVLMSVCPEDLEIGVSKVLPSHTLLLGTFPESV